MSSCGVTEEAVNDSMERWTAEHQGERMDIILGPAMVTEIRDSPTYSHMLTAIHSLRVNQRRCLVPVLADGAINKFYYYRIKFNKR